MSYMCIICMECLTYDTNSKAKSCKLGKITSTKCGHIFHGQCLQQWFEKIEKNNSNVKISEDRIAKSCPICQRGINPRDCKPIFPTEEVEITNRGEMDNALKVPDLCKLPSSISLPKKSTVDLRNPFDSASISKQETKYIETTVNGLSKGDIVVWFLEGGDNKEIGSVIWIGTINGIAQACVKFISPIGDGSREENHQQLRDYDSKYCKMIPVGELVLYLDCFGYGSVKNDH